MKKGLRILTILAITIGVFAVIGWKLTDNKKKIDSSAAKAQIRNTTVMVSSTFPKPTEMKKDFSSNGSFRAFKEVPIISEAAGRVTQVNFENGKQVQEGNVLVALDADLLLNQLSQVKFNMEKAKKDVQRLTNLLPVGGISQQQLDDAINAQENLKFQQITLEKQISFSKVKAPLSGTISNKMVEKGSFITPPMKLGDIVQTNKLYFQTYLTAEQLSFIKEGFVADIMADAMPDQNIKGAVTLIDVKADPSRRYLVELLVANPGKLRPGMTGQVSFNNMVSTEVLAIPRSCLVGSSRNASVYVIENGKAILRPIQVGIPSGNIVAVLSGLTITDEIVLTGQINLVDGAPVNVKNK
jgi:RND family efflux transporter MFP subunit